MLKLQTNSAAGCASPAGLVLTVCAHASVPSTSTAIRVTRLPAGAEYSTVTSIVPATLLGSTGLVVPPGDAGALAEGSERILDLSPEEYGCLRHAARERVVREFSVEALVDRTWTALGGEQVGRLFPGEAFVE